MLKLALTHHGHSFASEQPLTPSPSNPAGSRSDRPQNTVRSDSNGLDDVPPVERESSVNPETPGNEGQENVMYL